MMTHGHHIEDCDICGEGFPQGSGYLREIDYGDGFAVTVCSSGHTDAQIKEEMARQVASAERLKLERKSK